jgi:hypothetical protein
MATQTLRPTNIGRAKTAGVSFVAYRRYRLTFDSIIRTQATDETTRELLRRQNKESLNTNWQATEGFL